MAKEAEQATKLAIENINKDAKEQADKAKLEAELMEKQAKELQSGTNEDQVKAAELEQQARQKRQQIDAETAKTVQRMMAEELRKRNLQQEYLRIEKALGQLLPQINEANLASQELHRDIVF